MTRRKTSERCGGCKNFDMADTWRSTFYGIFCEGTCSITEKAIHNMHYACKDYIPCCVGNMTLIGV
ncbi:MAG: hypothetical protein J6S67_00245 [Methanobrevibacter sp.]|nr:hypothetical protein [Methanobrevibacter sp.]